MDEIRAAANTTEIDIIATKNVVGETIVLIRDMITHLLERGRVEEAERMLMLIGKNVDILPIESETVKGHQMMVRPKNEEIATEDEEGMRGNDMGTEVMMKVD